MACSAAGLVLRLQSHRGAGGGRGEGGWCLWELQIVIKINGGPKAWGVVGRPGLRTAPARDPHARQAPGCGTSQGGTDILTTSHQPFFISAIYIPLPCALYDGGETILLFSRLESIVTVLIFLKSCRLLPRLLIRKTHPAQSAALHVMLPSCDAPMSCIVHDLPGPIWFGLWTRKQASYLQLG